MQFINLIILLKNNQSKRDINKIVKNIISEINAKAYGPIVINHYQCIN